MIIDELWQFPVKGLGGVTLDEARLSGRHFRETDSSPSPMAIPATPTWRRVNGEKALFYS